MYYLYIQYIWCIQDDLKALEAKGLRGDECCLSHKGLSHLSSPFSQPGTKSILIIVMLNLFSGQDCCSVVFSKLPS